jgi:hypothetical protein
MSKLTNSKNSINILPQKKSVFQCEYCPQSFSRRGAFRNHLRLHRDQIFLDENQLTREITMPSTSLQRTVLSPILDNNNVDLHNNQATLLEDWEDDTIAIDIDFGKTAEVGYLYRK